MGGNDGNNEARARILINQLLADKGWDVKDARRSVQLEAYTPSREGQADYLLLDRHGRPLAVVEAKREGAVLEAAGPQAVGYAKEFGLSYIFVSDGQKILCQNLKRDAHLRSIRTFYTQKDLERRVNLEKEPDDDLFAFPIDEEIVNRPYQHKCIDAVCREWKRGKRKFLVEMATGTGKTRTTIALIKRLFDAKVVSRVLWLNDRILLARQTDEAFREHLKEAAPHLFTGGRGRDDSAPVVISTLQTMQQVCEEYSSGFFDLVVVDECHRSIYGEWRRVLRHFDARQLGLTATPCLADPNEMAYVKDQESLRDTYELFECENGRPTYQYSLKQGIRDKVLVPYNIYKATTFITQAENGYPVRRDDILDWDSMGEENRRKLESLFAEQEVITLEPRMLERVFTVPQRNEKIAREFRKIFKRGFTGSDGQIRKPNPDGKTIVFAVTKQHAATLARYLDDQFKDMKPEGRPEVPYADFIVSSEGSLQANMDKVKRFKEEEFPKILVSVDMLDAGFDLSTVTSLVMVRLTQSTIKYQQMRGRGTRTSKAIRKDSFVIFDFVGVCDRHGDDEDTMPSGGVVVRQGGTPPPKTPSDIVTLDIPDDIDPSSREWISINEHGEYEYTPEQEIRRQQMDAAFESWFKDEEKGRGEPFDALQSRILGVVQSQLRENAGTIEAWDEGRFLRPPFTSVASGLRPKEYYRIAFGGEQGLRAMVASLNRLLRGRGEKGRE